MKTLFSKLVSTCFSLLLFTAPAFAQASTAIDTSSVRAWSIGVRFKNPSGISVKRYLGKHALELNIGTIRHWKNYHHGYLTNTNDKPEDGYYFHHVDRISGPLAMQLHYVQHNVLMNFPGLTCYYGFGAQMRTGNYYYHYYYYDNTDTKVYGKDYRRFMALGVDGVFGIDYTFKSIPFTLFIDVTAYLEAVHQPFFFQMKTGSGLRYNF